MIIKKMCKLKPTVGDCYFCIDKQIDMCTHKDCACCEHVSVECELLDIVPGWFGRDYAYVMKKGRIRRVRLERVFDGKYVCEEGVSNG